MAKDVKPRATRKPRRRQPPKIRWGDDEYRDDEELLNAVAAHVAGEMDNARLGIVRQGNKTRYFRFTVRPWADGSRYVHIELVP